MVFYGSVGLSVCLWLTLFGHMRRFLHGMQEIRTYGDLSRFRRMARIQMYGALCLGVVAFVPFIVWGAGLVLGWPISGWEQLSVVLHGLFFTFGTPIANRLEGEVQGMPAATDHLQQAVEDTVAVWQERMFPDW